MPNQTVLLASRSPNVFQTAYVTNDLDRAVDIFKQHFGVPGFYIGADHPIPHAKGGSATIRPAIAWIGAVQLEIIEPRGGRDDIYRDALPREGFGLCFHHFCARAATQLDFEARKQEFAAQGSEIVFEYDVSSIRAFYADTRALLGHVIEYVWIESDDMLTLNGKIPRY